MIENNYLWSTQPQMGHLYFTPSAWLRDHYRQGVIVTARGGGRGGVGWKGTGPEYYVQVVLHKGSLKKEKSIWIANCYKLLVKIVFSVETIQYRI